MLRLSVDKTLKPGFPDATGPAVVLMEFVNQLIVLFNGEHSADLRRIAAEADCREKDNPTVFLRMMLRNPDSTIHFPPGIASRDTVRHMDVVIREMDKLFAYLREAGGGAYIPRMEYAILQQWLNAMRPDTACARKKQLRDWLIGDLLRYPELFTSLERKYPDCRLPEVRAWFARELLAEEKIFDVMGRIANLSRKGSEIW